MGDGHDSDPLSGPPPTTTQTTLNLSPFRLQVLQTVDGLRDRLQQTLDEVILDIYMYIIFQDARVGGDMFVAEYCSESLYMHSSVLIPLQLSPPDADDGLTDGSTSVPT